MPSDAAEIGNVASGARCVRSVVARGPVARWRGGRRENSWDAERARTSGHSRVGADVHKSLACPVRATIGAECLDGS